MKEVTKEFLKVILAGILVLIGFVGWIFVIVAIVHFTLKFW